MGAPEFLAVGHLARDLSSEGYRPGGAAAYGALTARRMGLSAAVVTSGGPDLADVTRELGVRLHVVPSAETTTFDNTYSAGRRRQALKGVAGPIGPPDVPDDWRSAGLVLLGPLAGEVSYELATHFPDSLVVASIQGWLRQWDSCGRVTPRHWDGEAVLPYVDAAVLSIDDVQDRAVIDRWAENTPVLIVTMGAQGARLHTKSGWRHIEPFPAVEVDPTGAGDVFAAAYLVRYRETGQALESARFASCAASFCVEALGVDGVPTRAQVQDRLSDVTG